MLRLAVDRLRVVLPGEAEDLREDAAVFRFVVVPDPEALDFTVRRPDAVEAERRVEAGFVPAFAEARFAVPDFVFDAAERVVLFLDDEEAEDFAVLRFEAPFARSDCAFFRVAADVLPFFGAGRSTPSRRASESPMAMACFRLFARPLPLFSFFTSSRTNSPACVEADFPALA